MSKNPVFHTFPAESSADQATTGQHTPFDDTGAIQPTSRLIASTPDRTATREAQVLIADALERRRILKFLGIGSLGYLAGSLVIRDFLFNKGSATAVATESVMVESAVNSLAADDRSKRFDQAYPDDVLLSVADYNLVQGLSQRMRALRAVIGFGRFNTLSFDSAQKLAKQHSRIGSFSAEEIAFLEELFYRDATEFGFRGERVVAQMNHTIARNKIVKHQGSGNYLYRGAASRMFHRMQVDIGVELSLTSGIRGVVKQASLFLHKTLAVDGNLSMASRSVAPPGYSYHTIGDFDVGQKSLGWDNFTEQFVFSDVYQRINELDYVSNRYAEENTLGVRFEPWHVKVI